MSKFNALGVLLCISGFLLLLFQALSSLMGEEAVWESMSLVDVAGKDYFTWVDNMSWLSLQNAANYIVTMPLFVLLLALGVLCLIIGSFLWK